MPLEIHAPLPPLRRKIRRSFFLLIGLYSFLGLFVAFGIFLASGTAPFDKKILLGSIVFLSIVLGLALVLADNLANRLAKPIKAIAEALRNDPSLERKLKLPRPTSLEMRILTQEIRELWERLRHFQKINISKLEEERERLETVLSSVEDAVLVLDQQGRILQSNDGMLRVLGLPSNAVINASWLDLSTANENYLRLREKLKTDLSLDNSLELTVNGRTRIFGARMRNITTQNQQTIGYLYLLHDITEARNRERLKAEFIAVLSHELRVPLETLGVASKQLLDKGNTIPLEARALAELIHDDTARIRAIAHDFVQLGSADLNSLKLQLQRLPISQNLLDWISPFRILARDKNVKFEFIHEGSKVIWANIDEVKLHWAISNLLGNAVKAAPSESTVTVYISDRANLAQIEIRDEGLCVPQEAQDQLFESQNNLMGLGLTISKQIVEAHEGRIEYFPCRPKGSIFRVSLPNIVVLT